MRKYGNCLRIPALCMALCLSAFFPQVLFAQVDNGFELYNPGEYEKAESKLRQVLKDRPQNTTARYYLGMSLLYQDQPCCSQRIRDRPGTGEGPYRPGTV